MNHAIHVRAFAKVNIGLRIGPRAQDGYHDLESIFQALDLGDDIDIRISGTKGISVRGDFGCPPSESTVYRAAAAFLARTGIQSGLSIEVRKAIPSMAGLGGGSADAAGVIAGLDRLLDTGLGAGELGTIGASIGSDVPFFLSGGSAFVAGRGEMVRRIEPRLEFSFLLIKPRFGISTPWAYRRLDEYRAEKCIDPARLPSGAGPAEARLALESPPETWTFANDFQAPLVDAFPDYRAIFGFLEDLGAAYSSITGSGSALYGVFPGEGAFGACERASKLLGEIPAPNTLSGMGLRALKPLETSLVLSYYPLR